MNEAETNLPKEILNKAVLSGREYGWRRKDVVAAIKAAPSFGLSVLGCQVQFRLPDGTCELYWMNFDPTDRNPCESWESFSARSAKETLVALDQIMSYDLIKEGTDHFEFLKSKMAKGENLEKYLVFIVYFQTNEEAEQKAGENASRPTA